MQQTAGNQAANRFLQSRQEDAKEKTNQSFSRTAQAGSNGSLDRPEEPLGEFIGEVADTLAVPPAGAIEDAGPAIDAAIDAGLEAVGAIAPAPAAPAPAAAGTVIRGPREMWNFDGQSPPNYLVSSRVSTNRRGGAFHWTVSPHLTLSSAAAARPTVTTVTPSTPPGRDAWIAVRHTDAGGATTSASYRLTILAPQSLTHLRNVDNASAGLGYSTEIHYSIHDQFGAVLPRNVPLNEQFTGPAVSDFPGENWVRPPACGAAGVCGAAFNPADWFDNVTGEVVTRAIPVPVAPTHILAPLPIEHWPGDWRIGGGVIGSGRLVSSVTWQANLGFARHT